MHVLSKKSFLGVRENYEIITALPWRHPPPSGRGGSERPSSRSLKLLTSDFSFCFLLFYSLLHLICSCLLFILNTKGFVLSKKPLFCALRLSVNIWKFSERDWKESVLYSDLKKNTSSSINGWWHFRRCITTWRSQPNTSLDSGLVPWGWSTPRHCVNT